MLKTRKMLKLGSALGVIAVAGFAAEYVQEQILSPDSTNEGIKTQDEDKNLKVFAGAGVGPFNHNNYQIEGGVSIPVGESSRVNLSYVGKPKGTLGNTGSALEAEFTKSIELGDEGETYLTLAGGLGLRLDGKPYITAGLGLENTDNGWHLLAETKSGYLVGGYDPQIETYEMIEICAPEFGQGMTTETNTYTRISGDAENGVKENDWATKVYVRLGKDINFNDVVSVTPFAQYNGLFQGTDNLINSYGGGVRVSGNGRIRPFAELMYNFSDYDSAEGVFGGAGIAVELGSHKKNKYHQPKFGKYGPMPGMH